MMCKSPAKPTASCLCRLLCTAVVLLQTVCAQTPAVVTRTLEVTLNKDDVFSIPFATLFPTLGTPKDCDTLVNSTMARLVTGGDSGATYLQVLVQHVVAAGGNKRHDVMVNAIKGSLLYQCDVSLVVLSDPVGRPEVDRAIRRFDAPFLRDSFVKFPLEPELFIGNGLQITADIVGAKGKPIGVYSSSTARLDFAYEGIGTKIKERNFTAFYLRDGFMVVADRSNDFYIFECSNASPLNVNCKKVSSTYGAGAYGTSQMTFLSAVRLTAETYCVVMQRLPEENKFVYISQGAYWNLWEGGDQFMLSSAFTMMPGFDEDEKGLQPTMILIGREKNVFLVQKSRLTQEVPIVTETICPQEVVCMGQNVWYLIGNCTEYYGIYAYSPSADGKSNQKVFQRVFGKHDKTLDKICIVGDSVLVAHRNDTHRELFLTNLRPDEDRREVFSLKEYGFTSDWTLECVHGNRLFAISAFDTEKKLYRYAVFDAMSSGKALKRMVSLVPGQQLELDAFAWNGDLVLAAFESPGFVLAYNTFADGPQIFVDANGTPASLSDSISDQSELLATTSVAAKTEIPFVVMLTVSDFQKHQIQVPFVTSVICQPENLTVTSLTKIETEQLSHWHLFSVVSIEGPVRNVTLKRKDTSATEETSIQVVGGLDWQVGPGAAHTFDGSNTVPTFLACARGLIVAGGIIASNQTGEKHSFKLMIWQEYDDGKTVEIKTDIVTGLGVFQASVWDSLWVVLSEDFLHGPIRGQLNMIKIDNGQVSLRKSYSAPGLRKIKVLPTDDGFLVLGFLKLSGLTIWKSLTSAPEQLLVGSTLEKVIDCSTYEFQKKISLICVTKRALEYQIYGIDNKGFVNLSDVRTIAPKYPDPRYMLLDVVCRETSEDVYLVSNTPTAYISEMRVSKKDLKFEQKIHFKLSYYEVSSLTFVGSHIVATVYSSKFGLKIHELHTWKSAFLLNGTGQLAYAEVMSDRDYIDRTASDYILPMAGEITGRNPYSGLVHAVYLHPDRPLVKTFIVDGISIYFRASKFDTSVFYLEFQGLTTHRVPLELLFTGKIPIFSWEYLKNLVWFLVLVIGVLATVLVWRLIVRAKQARKAKDEPTLDTDNMDSSLTALQEGLTEDLSDHKD